MQWNDTNKIKPYRFGTDILAVNKEKEYRVCKLIFSSDKEERFIINGSEKEFFPIRWAFIGKSGKIKERLKYQIGDKIKFNTCFPRKCSERWAGPTFHIWENDICVNCKEKKHIYNELNVCLHKNRQLTPYPDDFCKEGFVVGARSVIMEDYKYHSGKSYGEDDDYDPPYVEGKYEMVLLVTKNIYQEPFIVKIRDIIEEKT